MTKSFSVKRILEQVTLKKRMATMENAQQKSVRSSNYDEIVGDWEVFVQTDSQAYRYIFISEDGSFIGIYPNLAILKTEPGRSSLVFHGADDEVTFYDKFRGCTFESGNLKIPCVTGQNPRTFNFRTVTNPGVFQTIHKKLNLQTGDILMGQTNRLPAAPPGRTISPPVYREYLLRRLRSRSAH